MSFTGRLADLLGITYRRKMRELDAKLALHKVRLDSFEHSLAAHKQRIDKFNAQDQNRNTEGGQK